MKLKINGDVVQVPDSLKSVTELLEYLKLNNQPKGKMTYNAVVAWLIAYQKKYGDDAI